MMMRIQGGRIAALLILCALLAGCSAGTRDESPAPLEGAAWPTPRPTPVASSPTPFPKVDPAQVRRVDDRSAAPVGAGLASAQGGTAAPTSSPVGAVGAVGAGARPAPTITPSPAISGATARVRGPKGLNVRKGPGTTFAVLAGLRAGDAVKVLGVNEPGRDWAFVETSSGKQGWVSLPLLELSGAPPDLPARSSTSPQSSTLAASRSASAGASVVNPQSTINNPQSGIRNHASPQSVLAFQLSSGGDIMVVNADGSGLRRLTQGIDPVLSPDGKQVAFTRWDGTDGSLWVINLDGSGLRQVAGGIKQAKHPTWSPDGRRIAVNFQHEGRLDPARKCTNLATDDVPDIPWNVDKDSVKVEIKGQSPYIMPYLCYTSPAARRKIRSPTPMPSARSGTRSTTGALSPAASTA
jgi:hypothetical protein